MRFTQDRRSLRHCTAAFLVLSIATPVLAQAPAPTAPATGDASYAIFVRGTDVGREQVNLTRSGSDWLITSTGRFGDVVINRFELKYTADWQPIELRIEATQGQNRLQLATSFGLTTAISEITQKGSTNTKTDQVSARTVVLPNNFYAGYEALAVRLAGAEQGAKLPVYVAPQLEVTLTVHGKTAEAVDTPSGVVRTERYQVSIQNPGGLIEATVTVDDRRRFARLDIPSALLSVVRSDLASVAVRPHTARNPTDTDVTIPGNGFNIAGTITLPAGAGKGQRHPAIVLVPGSGSVDRDVTVAGIPIFSHLAAALAERGYLVLRYDKRGVGQSGGRTETASLQDYADDVVAIVRWLSRRRDVDRTRMTVVGHSEGGPVVMLASAREDRIKSTVLVASPGINGADLILEQQRHQLGILQMSEAEQQEKIALQKRIQHAVTTGEGWDEVPEDLRRQADTPWFRSLLLFDPAETMPRIRQPVLIVQGDLDTQVPPHHADKLAELARERRRSPPTDVVHIAGVNHLLVRATTGEVQEYPDLKEKRISPEVASAIVSWLKK